MNDCELYKLLESDPAAIDQKDLHRVLFAMQDMFVIALRGATNHYDVFWIEFVDAQQALYDLAVHKLTHAYNTITCLARKVSFLKSCGLIDTRSKCQNCYKVFEDFSIREGHKCVGVKSRGASKECYTANAKSGSIWKR